VTPFRPAEVRAGRLLIVVSCLGYSSVGIYGSPKRPWTFTELRAVANHKILFSKVTAERTSNPTHLISEFKRCSFFKLLAAVHRDTNMQLNHIPGEERVFLQPRDKPKP
jgi:hypothetical protein